MAGYFELKKASNGKFMFNLKAGNNQVVLTSETYSSKDAAADGISSVKKNAGADKNYERKAAKNGQAFFTLKSADNDRTQRALYVDRRHGKGNQGGDGRRQGRQDQGGLIAVSSTRDGLRHTTRTCDPDRHARSGFLRHIARNGAVSSPRGPPSWCRQDRAAIPTQSRHMSPVKLETGAHSPRTGRYG